MLDQAGSTAEACRCISFAEQPRNRNTANVARQLKMLSGLTPYEYIARIWTPEPERLIAISTHQMPGLNT